MTHRRDCILALAAAALTPRFTGTAAAQAQAEAYADTASADRWMQSWIDPARAADPSSTKAPHGALHVGRFADPTYYLTSVVGWNPEPSQSASYQPVRVPIGFVTDFASIPRLFWSALRPDGNYSYAAVIHDYLYWEQYLSREASDDIFKLCMEDFKIDVAVVGAVHIGVRAGGGFAWSDNANRRAAGERRVIRKFPSDPRVSWADWKRNADVF